MLRGAFKDLFKGLPGINKINTNGSIAGTLAGRGASAETEGWYYVKSREAGDTAARLAAGVRGKDHIHIFKNGGGGFPAGGKNTLVAYWGQLRPVFRTGNASWDHWTPASLGSAIKTKWLRGQDPGEEVFADPRDMTLVLNKMWNNYDDNSRKNRMGYPRRIP